MNRLLQILNFLGVLALVWLCGLQWKDNGRLHADGEDLERTRQAQAAKIAEQEKTLQGYSSDLDDLRNKLSKSDAALKETQGKLAAMSKERDQVVAARDQLTKERDQLKADIETWRANLAQRDDLLKQANEQVQKANEQAQKSQADRNDAVNRYNDIVNKYNAVVKQLDSRKG